MHKAVRRVLFLFALSLLLPAPASAAQSYDNCAGFIDSLPATISTQGTWCLRRDLSLPSAGSTGLFLTANNITIDCNHYKLGGLSAGAGTSAYGITASGKLNITVRNCNIRGFKYGIYLDGGGGHVVEDNGFDGNTVGALSVTGDGSVVRRNRVLNTGGSSIETGVAFGIAAGLDVDVLDNTVSGVLPTPNGGGHGDAYGISAGTGSVSGNRVRSVVSLGNGYNYGISINYDINTVLGRAIMRDNEVVGVGSGVGLYCFSDRDSAKDNVVSGYTSGILGCTDAGGNVSN